MAVISRFFRWERGRRAEEEGSGDIEARALSPWYAGVVVRVGGYIYLVAYIRCTVGDPISVIAVGYWYTRMVAAQASSRRLEGQIRR